MNRTPRGLARTWWALALVGGGACSRGGSGHDAGLPPEKVADYVHAVIAADRATYAEEVVHRLQDVEKVVRATEQFNRAVMESSPDCINCGENSESVSCEIPVNVIGVAIR